MSLLRKYLKREAVYDKTLVCKSCNTDTVWYTVGVGKSCSMCGEIQ